MSESTLNAALRHFEATEANLVKAEKLLTEIEAAIPNGVAFAGSPAYDASCLDFDALIAALPKIDGWKPAIDLMDLDEIAQQRMDAQDIGDVECIVSVERRIEEPARLLREYRHRFNRKRRALVRGALMESMNSVDQSLRILSRLLEGGERSNAIIEDEEFERLRENVAEIETLLGGSVSKPARWGDLHRHLHFGMIADLHDIIEHDWPSVKAGLRKTMYGETEPVPVEIDDLGALVETKPKGRVATKLKWESLTDEQFERLIFSLISAESGYENAEWLTKTNAPDRGRDLSVYRVYTDSLGGTQRQRVIIQCKHWQSKSVAPTDITVLRDKMKLWEPPRVDVHVIATSGRFTADAVALVEKHNQSDSALRIEMWPESHLERVLANRPAMIAEFGLR